MAIIKVSSTKTEKKRFIFRPLKKSRKMWILEEELERNYNMDACHDGGWEKEDSYLYLSSSRESHEKLLAEIIQKREKQGWEPEENHSRNILIRCFGDSRFRLTYRSYQEEVILNENR